LGGDAGQYSVVVSNTAGSVASSSAALTVVDPVITSQPAGVVQYAGQSVQFSVGVAGTSPGYQWLKNGFPIDGAVSASLNVANISDADAAGYSVVVSNAFGMETTSVAVLSVLDLPPGETNYAQLSFSAPVVSVSQTGIVAISLIASAGVTNLTFTLDAPADRVNSLTVRSLAPGVGLTGQNPPGAAHALITITGIEGRVLPNQQPLIEVVLQASTNQSSSLDTLTASAVTALRANGQPLPNELGAGTTLVFGPQPLMKAQLLPGGRRCLVIYAPPGNSYQIESSGSLTGAAGWTTEFTTTPTNSPVQIIQIIGTNSATMFYRVSSF
jgi:hypothetical protein